MTKINIIDDMYGDVYGDRTYTNHSIKGIEISKNNYCEFETCFDIPENSDKTYYLVYVNYDTGDSFGRDEGKISFIDLYETFSKAEDTAKRIRVHYNTNKELYVDEKYSLTVIAENGKEYNICPSWMGCFERLNYIVVLPVTLETKNMRY